MDPLERWTPPQKNKPDPTQTCNPHPTPNIPYEYGIKGIVFSGPVMVIAASINQQKILNFSIDFVVVLVVDSDNAMIELQHMKF